MVICNDMFLHLIFINLTLIENSSCLYYNDWLKNKTARENFSEWMLLVLLDNYFASNECVCRRESLGQV